MPAFIISRSRYCEGWVWIHTSPATAELFQLASLQRQFERRLGCTVRDPALWGFRPKGRDNAWFRVVLNEKHPSGTHKMPRFSAPPDMPKKALRVLADHFDCIGLPWLRFLDGRGESDYYREFGPSIEHRVFLEKSSPRQAGGGLDLAVPV